MSTEALNNEVENNATGDGFVEDVQTTQTEPTGAKPTSSETVPPNDDLRNALASLTENVNKLAAPKAEPKVQETPEQFAERWAVYNPEKTDPEFFRKFLRLNTDMNPEEVQKAVAEFKGLFGNLQHGLVRQAVVGARNLFMDELKKRDDELAELRSYVSAEKATKIRGRFEDGYPALADKAYSPILKIVATDLANKEFADETSYFKALAEGAANLIKGVRPDFSLESENQNRNSKSAASTPRLPRTRVGGTGGTGAGNAQAATAGANGDDASTLDWS